MGYLDNSGLSYLWGKIKTALGGKQDKESSVSVPGSGALSMSESLGSGPYTIEFTEEAGSGESSGESFAIGDVRLTTKTELGENWVLANGTIISAEDYPKYVEEFPFKFRTSYKENLFGETSGPSGNSVLQYINGNYICVFQNKIYYASSPDANWTESVIIPAGSSGTINDFLFANGYYVAASQFYDSDHWVSRVWYASDLNGPWSAVDVHQSTGTGSYGRSVQYINGQFVLMTSETVNSVAKYYFYTAQSPDGAWAAIPMDFIPRVWRIVYAEGKYVLCVMQQDENSTWHVGLKYASSLNGPWEYQDVCERKNSYSPNLFTYLNGKYLIFQKYVETAASYNAILFSDSIGGEWTFSELSLRDGTISAVVYEGGMYYAAFCGFKTVSSSTTYYLGCVFSEDLQNWEIGYITSLAGSVSSCGLLVHDYFLICSAQPNASPVNNGIRYYDMRFRKLPTINIAGVNTFIKVG